LGFDGIDQFTIAWGNLRNGPLKLKNFSLRVSGRALLFSYTFDASVLATQQLKLWKSNNDTKYTSVIDIDYSTEGKGNFISDHNKEQNTFTTGINADIDRPLHSNGQRIFSKTSATIILIREGDSVTTAVLGGQINPAEAFEDNRFKQLNSFALSNALILVNPLKSFFLTGKLSSIGAVIAGQCIIQFPVRSIDHTLPDPYITSLFDEQRADNANEQPTGTLRATVRWGDAAEPELVLQLEAETGGVPTFKSTLSDEEFAKNILRLPLPHPDKDAFENVLRNALTLAGSPVNVASDEQPYINYKSEYQSNINSAGAYAALHLWPGDISLLDVSGRASQMGIAFTKRVDNAVSSNKAVADNAGYHTNLFYRIEKNQMVTSGRFVRAFTLPHVQWEPIYAKDDNNENNGLAKEIPFPDHGVPTRIASANRADVALAPAAVAKYIVDGFNDEKNEFAAAAHFALPFGMNAVAFFHPFVKDVELRTFKLPKSETKIVIKEPYAYSILSLNQPRFTFKNRGLFGAMQIKVASEGAPNIQRDENELPDPSFHGAVFQTPNVITNIITNVSPPDLTVHKEDSILGDPVTKQFNRVMYGNYVGINGPPALRFKRSEEAKVPLRRIDFSGFGTSVFSNWFNKFANAGGVSQVKFDILVGRVKHEVIQIKSIIIPFFVPVVRTIVIERKNHGNIIRTDSGWVATGPGEFHAGYDCHPGVIKGAYNVTSIKDTSIALAQQLVTPDPDNGSIQNVELAGVYYDADMLIENVVSGFKNTAANFDAGYKLVPSKKQFGYIMLGNAKTALEFYYTNTDLQNFLKRPEVGPLGGPLDCVVNIAGTDQMMHMTRAEVGASLSASLVAAARGTLHFPKGGSWSVVKKLSNGTIAPLNNDETVPLIRHGKLKFKGQRPLAPEFKGSLHVLGTPSEIEKYAASNNLPADIEYALLQSTGTQKMLFPRPSFDANNLSDDKSRVEPQISFAKPLIADPYSLLKSNAIFPNTADAFTLQNVKTGIIANILTITRATDNLSFPKDINDALAEFCPPEAKPAGGKSRKLYLVKEDAFKVYIDYGISDTDDKNLSKQLFTAALNADSKPWEIRNKKVAIVVELASFTPLLTVQGDFTAEPGEKPVFNNAEIIWGSDENLQKIVQVLTILSMLATVEEGGKDLVKEGFSFAMGNSPDSWSYKCTIEEKIPVIQFPNSVQLSQLPGPAPLIVQAGLDLGVFFNLSLSADPNNLIKAGAGIIIGFEATIQVLLISIEVATAYGVGTAKVEVFVELPEAKPTFKFTMGFGATVAVQLPMVGYVSLTRVISLGVAIDHSPTMTVGQMLRGVLTIAGGLASVAVQVEASGTVTDKNAGVEPREWTAIVRGVFSLDVTVAFVVSWDFSEDFEHEIALPNPF
jgi:hypothetical protein